MFSWNAIKQGFTVTSKALIKAAPTLGVIFGVGLMGAGAVKTGVETPKMVEELKVLDAKEGLTHKEYLKQKAFILAKHLGMPVLMEAGGAAMIFSGYKLKYTQVAIATAALASKTEEADKLEQKVIEKYGPKEYEKMKDEIAKDDVRAHPINYSTIINTGHGNTLCYDPIFHDYYWSDLDYIRRMADSLNKDMAQSWKRLSKSAVNYNTWRNYLDLPASNENENSVIDSVVTDVDLGKDLGWYNNPIQIVFTVMLLSDDTPCHIVGFAKDGGPKWNLNLEDHDKESFDSVIDTDDETDMPWRG